MDRLYGINLIAVLIDAYENQEFSGRLMHPWSAEAIPFASCMELMTKMEALYDAWDYPEAAQGMRVFIRHRSDAAPRAFVSENGLQSCRRNRRRGTSGESVAVSRAFSCGRRCASMRAGRVSLPGSRAIAASLFRAHWSCSGRSIRA